ncbi:unnamed protein product [Parascedosporium putredinis]|uniref:Uncharacterized protein n=1 Tax=Parascedosporium putredinis TaxID=1442378 RepID=A0A9P1GWJ1_9PEZI|nr:unnamed protein product [Parascedosporium putredinis]CAI7988814.1 unnamed protein product [Parascedosporium putredinis]
MASQPSKPRRPILQINTTQVPPSRISSSRKIVVVDPKDPTAFNTLSNVYATVIDRSTPVQAEPLTAIKTRQPLQIQTTGLKGAEDAKRTVTPFIPYGPSYPETPLTAHPKSPMNNPEFILPSTMTNTPPLSAGPVESTTPSFSFAPSDMVRRLGASTEATTPIAVAVPTTPRQTRSGPFSKPPRPTSTRAASTASCETPLTPFQRPYPAFAAEAIPAPARKAAKRVGYNSPIEQTIVNSKYVFSHVDLLAEDASPSPMSPALPQVLPTVETVACYSGEERTPGDITPGPLEDMRRKMANLEDDPDEEVGGAIAALRAAEAAAKAKDDVDITAPAMAPGALVAEEAPLQLQLQQLLPTIYVPSSAGYAPDATPSLCSQDSSAESHDVDMSDSSSFCRRAAAAP